MPRIRALKPETPSDRKLATVSREARLTFLYTLTVADDDGLFRAEPRQLLGDLYPFDEDVTLETLETWLAELVGIEVIRWRETRDGSRVGEIVNWSKHQNVKNRAKPFLKNEIRPRSGDPPEDGRRTDGGPPSLSPEVLKPDSPEVLKPDAGSPDVSYTVRCVIALNDALRTNERIGYPREVPATTQVGLVTWEQDGIPLEVATQVIRDVTLRYRPTPGNPQPRSLNYFDNPVREAWMRQRDPGLQPRTTTVERSDGALMLKTGGTRG